jgi:protein-L-isoaspartate(D-aspartate) O-methyltransferase
MTELNIEQARLNMIEQQIRPWDVLDQRVLDTIAATPREDFVPAAYRNLAFADIAVPIDQGQAMLPPKLEGRLLQALNPQPHELVLVIGTGSGYLTALLAKLGKHVYSVDLHESLVQAAQVRLAEHGIANVTLETGDAARGWPGHAPYDVIAVTGSVAEPADELLQQLRVGGRMFVVVGEDPVMEARLITRAGPDHWSSEDLFETSLAPLEHAAPEPRFVF